MRKKFNKKLNKKAYKKAYNKAFYKLFEQYMPIREEIEQAAFDAICYGEGFVYINWDKDDNITVKRLKMRDLLK